MSSEVIVDLTVSSDKGVIITDELNKVAEYVEKYPDVDAKATVDEIASSVYAMIEAGEFDPAVDLVERAPAVAISNELYPAEGKFDPLDFGDQEYLPALALKKETTGEIRPLLSDAEVAKRTDIPKQIPTKSDRPKLTVDERNAIKDSQFRKVVASEQWAGLAAIKGQIKFAPEKKPYKGKGGFKQQQSRKPFAQKKK